VRDRSTRGDRTPLHMTTPSADRVYSYFAVHNEVTLGEGGDVVHDVYMPDTGFICGQGSTQEEAVADASVKLTYDIDDMAHRGAPVPAASTKERIDAIGMSGREGGRDARIKYCGVV
jgi:hypothetical protein